MLMPIWEIADALYKAGLRKEYEALKEYIHERDALFDERDSLRTQLEACHEAYRPS